MSERPASTNEHKRAVLDVVYETWIRHPDMPLCGLLYAAVHLRQCGLFRTIDDDLLITYLAWFGR